MSAVLVAGVEVDMNGYGKAGKSVTEELAIDKVGGPMDQRSLGK